MAFESFRVKFFFIGFLFSYILVQNVVSEDNGEYAETQNESSAADKSSDSSDQESDSSFNDELLKKHNEYRATHRVDPLTLKSEISAYAQEWANELAAKDKFEHRPSPHKYGENIYKMSSSSADFKLNPDDVVNAWCGEEKNYNYNDSEANNWERGTGHFSQAVWKGTTDMGCGKTQKGGGTWVVCNYDPAGNVQGQFKENVLKPE